MKRRNSLIIALICLYALGFFGNFVAKQASQNASITQMQYLKNKAENPEAIVGLVVSDKQMRINELTVWFSPIFGLISIIVFGIFLYSEAKHNNKPKLIWTLLGCMFQLLAVILFYLYNQYYKTKEIS